MSLRCSMLFHAIPCLRVGAWSFGLEYFTDKNSSKKEEKSRE